MNGINGIDRNDLDEVICTTYKELKTAIRTYSETSVRIYSQSLRALVELRQQVVAEER